MVHSKGKNCSVEAFRHESRTGVWTGVWEEDGPRDSCPAGTRQPQPGQARQSLFLLAEARRFPCLPPLRCSPAVGGGNWGQAGRERQVGMEPHEWQRPAPAEGSLMGCVPQDAAMLVAAGHPAAGTWRAQNTSHCPPAALPPRRTPHLWFGLSSLLSPEGRKTMVMSQKDLGLCIRLRWLKFQCYQFQCYRFQRYHLQAQRCTDWEANQADLLVPWLLGFPRP